jgi:hypothetical protein
LMQACVPDDTSLDSSQRTAARRVCQSIDCV